MHQTHRKNAYHAKASQAAELARIRLIDWLLVLTWIFLAGTFYVNY